MMSGVPTIPDQPSISFSRMDGTQRTPPPTPKPREKRKTESGAVWAKKETEKNNNHRRNRIEYLKFNIRKIKISFVCNRIPTKSLNTLNYCEWLRVQGYFRSKYIPNGILWV